MRDAARLVAERHAEGVGGVGEECGDAGKVECAGAQPEIIVEELSKLAADLERMPSAQAAHGVAGHKGRVAAPRREDRRTAEVKSATGNVDLRQSDGLGNTVADAEIGGVELRIRLRRAGEAIQTEARNSLMRFCPKVCVSFSEKNCLCGALDVSEAGNGVTPHAGLYGLREVEAVVAVQPVALTEDVTDVHPPLIRVDGRGRRTDETRRSRGVDEVRPRDQFDQFAITPLVADLRSASLRTRLLRSTCCDWRRPS